MVQVRFKAQGANSLLGGFSSGDVARVNAEFARHLVEEAKVADYVNPPAASQPATEEPKPARRVKVSK